MSWLSHHFPNASFAVYLAWSRQWSRLRRATADYLAYGITEAESWCIQEDLAQWLLPRLIIFRRDYDAGSGAACWAPEDYTIEEWVQNLDQGIEALRWCCGDDTGTTHEQDLRYNEQVKWVLDNVGAMWT